MRHDEVLRVQFAEYNPNPATGHPNASLRVFDVVEPIARSMFSVIITHNQSGLVWQRGTEGSTWTVIGSWNVEGFVNRSPWHSEVPRRFDPAPAKLHLQQHRREHY